MAYAPTRWRFTRRPPKDWRYHVTLEEESAVLLKRLGRGNLSEGMRQAAWFARTMDFEFHPEVYDAFPQPLPPDEAVTMARELIARWRDYFKTGGESESPESLLKDCWIFDRATD